jgi:glycine dehydrogenase
MHAVTPSLNEASSLSPLDTFPRRHIGPDPLEQQAMLTAIGVKSLNELIDQTLPPTIRLPKPLTLPHAHSESEALASIKTLASKNKVFKSFLGMGYYDTITPGVILRNILENPGWYTQYTPYQAEIAQGRLEALLNFQTMVSDLTALPLANASMLDEATAAAEAMNMCYSLHEDRPKFFVAHDVHPQTLGVVKTRAKWLGIAIEVGDPATLSTQHSALSTFCGILLQYPTTDGQILDYGPLTEAAHQHNTQIVAATDLLALTLIKPPGEWSGGGADIAVGNAQRFGVPMGFGGPHAAFMACKSEFTRKLPGRIVGVSKDAHGNPAFRLALQTREQHIRREKATSNICTAQVLLAIMASMYAVYHGPDGLKAIAERVRTLTHTLGATLRLMDYHVLHGNIFDTLVIEPHPGTNATDLLERATQQGYNFRSLPNNRIGISLDETSTKGDIDRICTILRHLKTKEDPTPKPTPPIPDNLDRTSTFLTHAVFNTFHAEHEMLRYINRLQHKDLSLTTSMIPLGSCTMKLNATSEMIPVTWPEFGKIHPFAPADQTAGYQQLFTELETWLAEITGFHAVSLQPNAGSQGEYAGLLAIRSYHEANNQSHRTICLIPTSAHGTNPASAVVAGLEVVPVSCDFQGNIDVGDLKKKAALHAANLSCIMITYPSTHGVFEETVKEICQIVHQHGGQVYMDGANMNAQVGLTSPGHIGADVCHLNLHKTFCIPHGGGGPGMGPIGVAKHLAPHLPKHPLTGKPLEMNNEQSPMNNPTDPMVVSAAPYGSASILPISYMYILMMGEPGLKLATETAILNANYMAKRLESHYPVLYRGTHGRCAHEFILDCRGFEDSANIKVEDIAKRLMDYGFHAPTMSWPVPGTLMFEPTESESKAELDRLCDAMIKIREEIRAIEDGKSDRTDNALKNAPHTAASLLSDSWNNKYTRESAAYPAPWTRQHKFWPSVGRIDNPYGDRNLVCTCPPMENYQGT